MKKLQLTYDVPPSETLKEKTLSYCSTRWRAFKTQLARDYIHNMKNKYATPCSKYTFIAEDTWWEFCKILTSQAMVS